MKAFFKGGVARRDRGTARRRAIEFSPSQPEALESKRLLAAGTLGLNVEINAFDSFVNLLQVPGDWGANPGQSNAITLNSSGDPSSDATLLFDLRVNQSFDGPDPNATPPNLSGTYSLCFNGQATIQPEYAGFSTPFTVENQTYTAATNTTTASLVVPSNSYSDFFGITFSNTQATQTSGTNTGFSNAVLIRPGYAANSTQVYTNQFLSALQPYNVLRYLDPEETNNQPFYNGNTLVTVNATQVDQTGLPWEYMVALANATKTDMWINIPEGATNDYVAAVAGIIKNGGTVDGVTYPGLNANLKIYVEYSNEVWGGIPDNEYYQEAAVQNQATNQPLSTFPGNTYIYTNPDGTTTTDVNTAVGRRYLERTAEIGQIFQSILGSDPNHQRIRPVLGWQENNPDFYPAALAWFEHFFGPASASFYGMGNANYWGPTDLSSVDAAIASLQAQETSYAIPNNIAYTTLATYYGLANVSYEGGPSIGADPTTAAGQVALAASRDPRMEQLVYQHYIDFYADGGALANYYDGPFGILTGTNNWPIAELSQYGDPSASSRYQGTVDVAEAPPVAVTAGTQISATSTTSFSATTDSLDTNFSDPETAQQGYWLLNAAVAGSYQLSLSISTQAGAGGNTSPGQFEVFLNDKEVGGLFIQNQTNSIAIGTLNLIAGLNTLSLVMVSSGAQFQPTSFTISPSHSFVVGDPGFETKVIGPGQYLYDPTGSSWTFAGSSGLSGNNSAFTNGNPVAPQGVQVAFLQQKGTITQSLANWTAGNYDLTFSAAQRGNFGNSAEDFEVLVDGSVVGTFKPTGTSYQTYTTSPFTVTAGTHKVAFVGLDSLGGDNTVFLDNVQVATATMPPGLPIVGDPGFENLSVASYQYLYDPIGSSWTFAGQSGLSGNNNALTGGNPVAPQGLQVAFLQEKGTITQSIASWEAGSYILSFSSAQRGDNGISKEDFEVLIDGSVVGTFKPTGTTYQTYSTSPFTVTTGTHTVEFVGLDTVGGDNTVFLDSVSITLASPPPVLATIGDPGFENEVVGAGQYLYDPTGSSWNFTGDAGLSGNNSAFTGGNSVAPQGSQVAFLQEKGTISQTIANWAAGSYTISFDAAQRADFGTSVEDFEILVDEVIVGTFKPAGTSYQTYSTSSFTVGAGSHTVSFVGLDSAGGDNTVFLDNVSIG